jgi:hypothetical protein
LAKAPERRTFSTYVKKVDLLCLQGFAHVQSFLDHHNLGLDAEGHLSGIQTMSVET